MNSRTKLIFLEFQAFAIFLLKFRNKEPKHDKNLFSKCIQKGFTVWKLRLLPFIFDKDFVKSMNVIFLSFFHFRVAVLESTLDIYSYTNVGPL